MKVTLSQFKPRKGDLEGNLGGIREEIASAASQGDDLLVFPETVLSAYFVEGAVSRVCRTPSWVAAQLDRPPQDSPDVVLGMYERGREGVHNSALYLTPADGEWVVTHVHRKVFLPTYGVFQEARFVVPGLRAHAFDTRFGRVGLLVCEDMHHSLLPTILALDGAEVLICLAASPARELGPGTGIPHSLERWDAVGRAIAMEHGVHFLVAHLVGSEGGKLMTGGSVAYGPGGEILGRGPIFREGALHLSLDPAARTRVRDRGPMLNDLRQRLPYLVDELTRVIHTPGSGDSSFSPGANGPEVPVPARVDPDDDSFLELDLALTTEALVGFLRDEIPERRGFQSVVLGLSGGVDSAVALALAARALGPENVHAILMPYATSSPESLDHGKVVAEKFGVDYRVIPITEGIDAYIEREGPEISGLRRGNLAARFRAMVLWDQSARLEALPLGTGNKSERLLGYFTWHADDAPPINPLGDLWKTQVWALARYLEVPPEVVDKPPSADLVEGVDDADEIGVGYRVADRILYWLVRDVEAESLIQAGFPEEAVTIVSRRLEGTHWKRKAPTIAMVSPSAIGEFYLRPVDY
jgi:NAD+ synthase (glutamine-hydrolysing)